MRRIDAVGAVVLALVLAGSIVAVVEAGAGPAGVICRVGPAASPRGS